MAASFTVTLLVLRDYSVLTDSAFNGPHQYAFSTTSKQHILAFAMKKYLILLSDKIL